MPVSGDEFATHAHLENCGSALGSDKAQPAGISVDGAFRSSHSAHGLPPVVPARHNKNIANYLKLHRLTADRKTEVNALRKAARPTNRTCANRNAAGVMNRTFHDGPTLKMCECLLYPGRNDVNFQSCLRAFLLRQCLFVVEGMFSRACSAATLW